MSHKIRQAVLDDAPRLASIDAAASINPWSARQFLLTCRDQSGGANTVLVIEDDGRIDGFVVFSQVLDEASIHNIAIHPALQGRKLGRTLLQATLENMARAGAERCLLEVRESNAIARNLYAGYGFVLDGVRKNYYPTHDGREDALLMSCKLEGSTHERT